MKTEDFHAATTFIILPVFSALYVLHRYPRPGIAESSGVDLYLHND